jgi:chemotaxis protein MotB
MMAFFLLMWLLGSTAKGDLQGLRLFQFAAEGGDGRRLRLGQQLQHHSRRRQRPGQGARPGAPLRADDNDRRKMDSTSRQIRAQQDAQRIKSLRAKIDAMIAAMPR